MKDLFDNGGFKLLVILPFIIAGEAYLRKEQRRVTLMNYYGQSYEDFEF